MENLSSFDWLVKSVEFLKRQGFDPFVLTRYSEPHRHYHTFDHIGYMLNLATNKGILTDSLYLAILFHDIVYDPLKSNNEEESVALFKSVAPRTLSVEDIQLIANAILDTKTHMPSTILAQWLVNLDLHIVREGTFVEFVEYDRKIFKEYQFVDYASYKTKRLEVLKHLDCKPEFIEYVENWKPMVAVYAGSFNPFHKGHKDIYDQATKVFYKVIIARGKNPDKVGVDLRPMPEWTKYVQVDTYDGLLTDYLKKISYPVTLVRGLRNEDDLMSETTQLAYLRDLYPEISVTFFISKPELAHISSSSIRMLEKYGMGAQYL